MCTRHKPGSVSAFGCGCGRGWVLIGFGGGIAVGGVGIRGKFTLQQQYYYSRRPTAVLFRGHMSGWCVCCGWQRCAPSRHWFCSRDRSGGGGGGWRLTAVGVAGMLATGSPRTNRWAFPKERCFSERGHGLADVSPRAPLGPREVIRQRGAPPAKTRHSFRKVSQ